MALQPLYSRHRVAHKIKEIRKERLDLTQAEFAEALGAPESQSQVSQWETGKVMPSEETLTKIADLAGLRLHYFIEGPIYEGAGALGEMIIEVAERMSDRFPRDEVLDVMQELVDEFLEGGAFGDGDMAAWRGYLRGVGLIRRMPTPPEASDGAASKLEAEETGAASADEAPPPPPREKPKEKGA